jgi:hypothetical protein
MLYISCIVAGTVCGSPKSISILYFQPLGVIGVISTGSIRIGTIDRNIPSAKYMYFECIGSTVNSDQ